MPRIFDGHRLRNAGKLIVAAGQAVAAHVDVNELLKIGVTAAVSGGNPAAIGGAILRGVLADLPKVLPNPDHQAAVADVVTAVQSVSAAIAGAKAAPSA